MAPKEISIESIRFATRRALRPKLWLVLLMVLVSILALGRYQWASARGADGSGGWPIKASWTVAREVPPAATAPGRR